jgi:hypothetical protein
LNLFLVKRRQIDHGQAGSEAICVIKSEGNLELAASKAGMDAKTARKYRRVGRLPSELKPGPRWRTRPDQFIDVWAVVRKLFENDPGLEAKTVFEHLQRVYPGRFQDGQVRTLQRKVKHWRATEGPSREVSSRSSIMPIGCAPRTSRTWKSWA